MFLDIYFQIDIDEYIYIYIYIIYVHILYRGRSPITDPLLIPTPYRISVTIRDIKKLYLHEMLVI